MPNEKVTWKDIDDMYKKSSSPGSERRRIKMEKFRQEHPGTKASDVYQEVIVTSKKLPIAAEPMKDIIVTRKKVQPKSTKLKKIDLESIRSKYKR